MNKIIFAIPLTEGKLCSHFGHCELFALVETESGKIKGKMMHRIPFDPVFTRTMVQGKTFFEYDGHSEGARAVKKIWEDLAQGFEM